VARGILVASLAWVVFLYGPVFLDPDRYLEIRVAHHHIQYDYFSIPLYSVVPQPLLRLLYFATMALPLALGGDGRMRWFGLLFAGSAVLSWLAYSYAFASVWCFFAAVLSGYLCLVFASLKGVAASPHGEAGAGASRSGPPPVQPECGCTPRGNRDP